MATALEELLPDVLTEVPRCPEPIASKAVVSAVQEFFRRSRVKKVELEPIDVVFDTAAYGLVNPTGYQILELYEADLDSQPLRIASRQELDLQWPTFSTFLADAYYRANDANSDLSKHWRYARQDRPRLIVGSEDPNSYRLVGIPTQSFEEGLIARVVVYPTRDVTEIDDWIFERHHEALIVGAQSQLLKVRDKPWTDPDRAAELEMIFSNLIDEARGEVVRGNKSQERTHLRVTPCR